MDSRPKDIPRSRKPVTRESIQSYCYRNRDPGCTLLLSVSVKEESDDSLWIPSPFDPAFERFVRSSRTITKNQSDGHERKKRREEMRNEFLTKSLHDYAREPILKRRAAKKRCVRFLQG